MKTTSNNRPSILPPSRSWLDSDLADYLAIWNRRADVLCGEAGITEWNFDRAYDLLLETPVGAAHLVRLELELEVHECAVAVSELSDILDAG